MKTTENRHLQFVSDALVQQVVEGRKTASVAWLHEVNKKVDDYNDELVCGAFYDVYDSALPTIANWRECSRSSEFR